MREQVNILSLELIWWKEEKLAVVDFSKGQILIPGPCSLFQQINVYRSNS